MMTVMLAVLMMVRVTSVSPQLVLMLMIMIMSSTMIMMMTTMTTMNMMTMMIRLAGYCRGTWARVTSMNNVDTWHCKRVIGIVDSLTATV